MTVKKLGDYFLEGKIPPSSIFKCDVQNYEYRVSSRGYLDDLEIVE